MIFLNIEKKKIWINKKDTFCFIGQIGITDLADQQKVLNAIQQMHLDKVDLDTISQLGAADSG